MLAISWRRIAPVAVAMVAVSACATDNEAVTALATKLADEGGENLPAGYRGGYIECGVEALSGLPRDRIAAALKAADAPARWEILGSDALDRYVDVCRKLDLKRRSPPAS